MRRVLRATPLSDFHRRVNRKAWRRVRLHVLERDGHRCADCGRAGRFEVDHVKPLHHGGAALDPDNLQALCRSCHFHKTAQENQRQIGPKEAAWRALVSKPLRLSDAVK